MCEFICILEGKVKVSFLTFDVLSNKKGNWEIQYDMVYVCASFLINEEGNKEAKEVNLISSAETLSL